MRFKDGKFHITKNDLKRSVILIKNYKTPGELASIQAGAIDAVESCLPIPIESFDSYNAFRVKNGEEPKTLNDVLIYDVDSMKEEIKEFKELEAKVKKEEKKKK